MPPPAPVATASAPPPPVSSATVEQARPAEPTAPAPRFDWLSGLDPDKVAKYTDEVPTTLAKAHVIDDCTPSHQNHNGEERQHVKHRAIPNHLPAAKNANVLATVAWGKPCDAATCNDDRPYPEEEETFRIDGDAWRIGLDKSDCDIHIEMAEPGKGVNDGRMIVEVPNDAQFKAIRRKIDDAVFASTHKHITGAPKDLTAPISLHFVGFRFWDGHHVCKNHDCPHPAQSAPGEHCSHGTRFVCGTWELHPVLAVETAP